LYRVQDGVDQTAKAGAGLEHSGAWFQSEQGRKLGGDWHGCLEELIGADCNGCGAVRVTARESVEAWFHFLHGEASGIVFHAELVEAVECVHVAGFLGMKSNRIA